MEEDLRARLTSDSGIKSSVKAASIAWGDRPPVLPGITLDYISDARPQHMEDFQPLRDTQVQVDVWASDKLQARDLRELVIGVIVPVATKGATRFGRAFIDRGPVSSFEMTSTGIVYRERIDFTIWHAPAA